MNTLNFMPGTQNKLVEIILTPNPNAVVDDDDKGFSAFYEDDVTLNRNQLETTNFWVDEIKEAVNDDDGDSSEDEDLGLPPPLTIPPFYSVQVIFNHENIWANLGPLDPTKCDYTIDNVVRWKAFCSFSDGFTLEGSEMKAFYDPPAIPAKLKVKRTKTIMGNISEAIP